LSAHGISWSIVFHFYVLYNIVTLVWGYCDLCCGLVAQMTITKNLD